MRTATHASPSPRATALSQAAATWRAAGGASGHGLGARAARLMLAASLLAVTASTAAAQAAAPAASTPSTAARPAAPVTVQTLREIALRPAREAPASVLARNESRLVAEVSAVIRRWGPDAGATVRRGDLLVELDDGDFRLAVERADAARGAAAARLELADAQRRRARDLLAQGFISSEAMAQRETEWKLAQSELASAQAQAQLARRQLAATRITAPFAGTVRQRLAQTGEVAAPGTPLYVLVESGALEVSAAVTEADLDGLRRAGAWRLEAPGGAWPLRLLRVSDAVSAATRTREARLAFTGTPRPAPGTEGRLVWSDARPHLPPQLLVRRNGQLGAFLREGGAARFRAIDAAQEGRAAAVDWPDTTEVVTRGHEALKDGQALPR